VDVVRHDTAQAAILAVRSLGKRIVTFLGFSGGGYEDPDEINRIMLERLGRFDPGSVVISAGATPDGIGAVYRIAKRLGFDTLGIVSSVAEEEGADFSRDVDTVHMVKDRSWGGLHEGVLSPTSIVMVQASDELIAIGGGEIARDEVEAARQAGKAVIYIRADMNHAAARSKAAKNDDPPPTTFEGPVDSLFH
jgi:hypothetical protein